MPTTIPNNSPQQLLEEIHKEFLGVLAKESTLRAERNEAVRAVVAQGASVTHLARAGGISRELLHRILRAAPSAQPGARGVAGDGDDVTALASIQKSLDAAVSKRAALEKQRALAIRRAVDGTGVTRTEIARWAGVSSETVRKVCLGP
ncbi:hypothetical protein [Arthrobacter glacialis]|uniref:Helix-turn-helix domain containing protein n=1 Tax=Arthrobacter glacialis TaxID=1664 RepID=A0A2S3ZTF9_ARTGL|nr:hypothetical protein [Arthrobacter glacialis]POH72508.1 hypothetical protein CVS27_15420 [Arthrobacter glacialis]